MLTNPVKYKLSELADRFQLELRGNGETCLDGVGTLKSATATQLGFLANPAYRPDLAHTRAGAVILKEDDAGNCPTSLFIAADPYLAYARMAALFVPNTRKAAFVHDSAVIEDEASVGENVWIGANVVIAARSVIGDGCVIGPGTVIESDSQLGRDCKIFANVSIGERVRLGQRVIVHPGAVLGADGFGIAFAGDQWEKVPQLGGVVIGDDCEIGANTTIDRGAIEDTVLEQDVRVDNLVQIAHNVHIGAHTAIAAMVGIAGSSRIGRYCMLAGRSAVSGHVEIADRVTIGANSVAFHDVEVEGSTHLGFFPSEPIKQWQRNLSHFRKLDSLARRIRVLEKDAGNSDKND